jgi:hypothetical protein
VYQVDEFIKYFVYLDQLRDSGITNMYAAGKYLEKEFAIGKPAASKILITWMETFDPNIMPEVRAATYISEH